MLRLFFVLFWYDQERSPETAVVAAALQRKADPNKKASDDDDEDWSGDNGTAVHLVAANRWSSNAAETLQLLLEAQADVNIPHTPKPTHHPKTRLRWVAFSRGAHNNEAHQIKT